MSTVLHTLDAWTTHQDYLWFLAALAWGGVVLGGWPRTAEGAPRAGLIVWALGNLFSAGVELHLLAMDVNGPYFAWDWAMAIAQSGATGGLLWMAAEKRLKEEARRGVIIGAVLVAAIAIRWMEPVVGSLGLLLLHLFAVRAQQGVAWLGEAEGAVSRRYRNAALMAGVFWVGLAPHGALAHALGVGRINQDLSPFALPAAGCLFVAGLACSVLVWRARLLSAGGAWRDGLVAGRFRRSLIWLGAWLVAGLALIVWSGRSAQEHLAASLRARVATAVELIDRATLARAFGPELVAQGVRPREIELPLGETRKSLQVHLPSTNSEDFRVLRAQLTRIHESNPDITFIYLTTVRAGHVVIAAIDQEPHPTFVWRWVLRPAAADEMTRAEGAQVRFAGPADTPFGPFVIAQAPLRAGAEGAVVGWLEFHFASTHWAAPATHARWQTMALVALGVAFWALSLAYELRRAVAAEAARKIAAAAEADRVRAAFIANVSHELRTPIQTILGFSELLAADCRAEPAKRWVAALHSQGEVMLQLVNDLIDHSALQNGVFQLHPRVVDLPQLVQEVVAAMQPRAAAKGLVTALSRAPDLPSHVWADPVRLRQILLNLVANAVKFTVQGEVRVTVRRVGETASSGPSLVEFVVADTGPGIAAADRARLFQPFARLAATNESEGAGLGLALVARLCSAMGGSVRLDDTAAPRGATFVVTLPLEISAVPVPPENPGPSTTPQVWRELRVLIADDNALVRELLMDFFQRHGAQVTTAADGEEAVACCARQPFDVALLDWMMPKCDGLEACRRLRQLPNTGDLFVLGLSAHAQGDGYARALAAGMNAFVAKPVNLAALAEILAEIPGVARLPAVAAPASDALLLSKLQLRFGAELPELVDEILRAAEAGDWARASARAHYLKNSADCVGARHLGLVCQQFGEQIRHPARAKLAVELLWQAAQQPFGPT